MTLIVITGPTGVGKTDLCLTLAEYFGTDIINADSRQIYAEIPIGTAAPTPEQLSRVRHHFVATHHIGDYYSASMYEKEVMQLIESPLLHTGIHNTAILTGGSMMYIDAVCNGIDDIPTVDDKTREWMKQRLQDEGLPALVEELQRLDPEHWAIVDKSNTRRVVHALEICHMTGRTYTSYRTGERKQRPFKIIKIGLTRDTILKVKRGQVIMDHSELYERINARVMQMMEQGLLDEVRTMLTHRNENALNTVGYKELFRYLDGTIPLDEAIRQIQSNTREYARKQLTWFKRDKEVTWFHPDNIEEIKRHIEMCICNDDKSDDTKTI